VPFDLRPVGLSFIETAPHSFVSHATIRHPPEPVFHAIAADPAGWGAWFPRFSGDGRYVTPAPHGAGSVREVAMSHLSYTEEILVWEEPTRWAFQVLRSTAPIANALVEDYRVAPTEDGHSSTVTWTFALEPRALLKPGMPLAPRVLARLWRRAAANLDAHLGTGGHEQA